jgi:hypothetical protein
MARTEVGDSTDAVQPRAIPTVSRKRPMILVLVLLVLAGLAAWLLYPGRGTPPQAAAERAEQIKAEMIKARSADQPLPPDQVDPSTVTPAAPSWTARKGMAAPKK